MAHHGLLWKHHGQCNVAGDPGDAVASSLMVADAPTTYMAGESYELVYERRDANGYMGLSHHPFTPHGVIRRSFR